MSQHTPHVDSQYRAFISYSHQDERWGNWLHRALEGYRVPRYLVGKQTSKTLIPRRLTPIFRDRDELPTATDLGDVVDDALRRSESLIVICSPAAARSRWVNQEILSFKRLGRADRILCLLVAGEPNAAEKPDLEAEECFPEALRRVVGPDGELTDQLTEPVAADVRPNGDGKTGAKLKLIAGLLGLGLDELKHREQHRRNQRLLAVTATALAVMIVTTLLAINAIVARAEAERRRAQAEDLIGFMLGDLRDRLEPIGRLDVLDGVGDKALQYFASLTDKDMTDEALGKRAMALCQIGEVRVAQGKLEEAESAFRDCLAPAQALSERDPNNGAWLFQEGQAHFWIGYVHWEQGDLDAATARFQQYLAVSRRLVELDPRNADWQLELSYVHNNLGTVLLDRGHVDEALKEFRTSIAIKESLVAAQPGNTDLKIDLGDSYSWLGSVLQAQGDLYEALDMHRADVAITAAALASDSSNTDMQWRLSAALRLLGELQEDLGDYAAAADNFEQALAISTELVNRDAENARWQHELGIAHAAIGRIRRINGGVKSALTHFRQSAAIMDRLVTLDDSLSEWRADAAWAHYWVAEAMLAMGDPEAAEREVAIAIAIGEQLLADVPDERQALPVVGEAYMLLGQIAARAGAGEESRVAFDRAAEILEPVARDSTDKTYLDPWARAVLHLDRVEDARPVVEELHRMGFKGWRLGELCQVKGVSMEGPVQQPGI